MDVLRQPDEVREVPGPSAADDLRFAGSTKFDLNVVAHVVHHFDPLYPGSFVPGDFTRALLQAFTRADLTNRRRLNVAFPEYGLAMSLALDNEDGLDWLRELLTTSLAEYHKNRA